MLKSSQVSNNPLSYSSFFKLFSGVPAGTYRITFPSLEEKHSAGQSSHEGWVALYGKSATTSYVELA